MPPNQSPGLQFVISTNVEKPNPNLRKEIRRHVMRGKNLGRVLPPRHPVSEKDQTPPSLSSEAFITRTPNTETSFVQHSDTLPPAPHRSFPISVPRSFGSPVSTIRFADDVDYGTTELVLQFAHLAKYILFPLAPCLLFPSQSAAWIRPLAADPAYLHAVIFTSQHYLDAAQGRNRDRVTRRTWIHYQKTLKLIRERIANEQDQIRLSDTTVATIMGLTGHAHLTGDYKAARNHMEGLLKIVNLRGGVSTFKRNAKLLIEILRCDIGISLHSGSSPVFFDQAAPHDLLLLYLDLDLGGLLNLETSCNYDSESEIAAFFNGIDHDLSLAWRAMLDFCSAINTAIDTGRRISIDVFLHTMTAVMYRLLVMRFETSSSDELLRLGLLAFSSSVFLQWQRMGSSYDDLTSKFRVRLISSLLSKISPHVRLWLLMVGSITVLDIASEEWLKLLLIKHLDTCLINSWDDLQGLLSPFPWIGHLHGKPGRAIFVSVSHSKGKT